MISAPLIAEVLHYFFFMSSCFSLLFFLSFFLFFFFLLVFLGQHPQHMELLRLGINLELHLSACPTATWNPSLVCNLHHCSQQRWIFNPLRQGIEPVSSWMLVRFVSTEPQWERCTSLLFQSFPGYFCILSLPNGLYWQLHTFRI